MPGRSELPKLFRGWYANIQLYVTPDGPQPLHDRSALRENYPTASGQLRVYLGGENAAEPLPPAPMLWLLGGLLLAYRDVAAHIASAATAEWVSDPWQFVLSESPHDSALVISLLAPGRWVVMDNVRVPMDQFGRELVVVSERWAQYLDGTYHDEVTDPARNKAYNTYLHHLRQVRSLLGIGPD